MVAQDQEVLPAMPVVVPVVPVVSLRGVLKAMVAQALSDLLVRRVLAMPQATDLLLLFQQEPILYPTILLKTVKTATAVAVAAVVPEETDKVSFHYMMVDGEAPAEVPVDKVEPEEPALKEVDLQLLSINTILPMAKSAMFH